jgi:hypothetical protein
MHDRRRHEPAGRPRQRPGRARGSCIHKLGGPHPSSCGSTSFRRPAPRGRNDVRAPAFTGAPCRSPAAAMAPKGRFARGTADVSIPRPTPSAPELFPRSYARPASQCVRAPQGSGSCSGIAHVCATRRRRWVSLGYRQSVRATHVFQLSRNELTEISQNPARQDALPVPTCTALIATAPFCADH